MNYTEAKNKALKTKWKIGTCNQGENCWCRMILPEFEIKDDDDNEIYIATSGTLNKEFAEHIVNLHNKSLEE